MREQSGSKPVPDVDVQRRQRLGESLRALRVAAGMTLHEVAADAGVGYRYLCQAENGLVSVTDGWVRIVAEAIGRRMADQQSELASTG